MADVHVEMKTHLDFDGRRLLAEFEGGIRDALREIAYEGEDLATGFAPVGHKFDPRTPTIQNSMFSESDDERAVWGSKARHAAAQELGGKAHLQSGDVSFWWEREERRWHPGKNQIKHPGNPDHPYLRPSLDIIYERYGEILRKNISRRVSA